MRNDDWAEPGTYQVAPHIFRIPLPLPNDGLKAVNVYAIEDGNSITLVDSGWALSESRDALTRALKVLGASLGDVSQFLVTHVHRDHYTQAVALRDVYGTPISLGEGERPTLDALRDPHFEPLEWRLTTLHANGADEVVERLTDRAGPPARMMRDWKLPDVWLKNGQEIEIGTRTLTAIETPGHTRGHVVFADKVNRLLFAGDHVLPHITPSIAYEPIPIRLPLQSYLESLRLVRRMPEMTLLPAHGGVTTGVHQRVDELLAHHDARLSSAFDAVCRGGAVTAFVVAKSLAWKGRDNHFEALDPFDQMLAVCESIAHLDLLVAQDRLRTRTAHGVVYYEVALNASTISEFRT